MQVSIACTEQNLRSRSSEDRLCGPRPGPGGGNGGPVGGGHGNPPGGGGSGPKAGAAVVPRTLAPAGALRESTRRATGMKYRYEGGWVARSICSLFRSLRHPRMPFEPPLTSLRRSQLTPFLLPHHRHTLSWSLSWSLSIPLTRRNSFTKVDEIL